MRRRVAVLLGLLAFPALATAQVVIEPPSISFATPPPLVEVEPGVQVVEDHSQEVFFVENSYWVRHGKHWYRTTDHRGGWEVVADPPPVLVRVPEGKYKHWKGPKGGKDKVYVVAEDGRVVKVKVKKEKKEKKEKKNKH